MLYPLRFHPVYKDYLWGGRRFESLRGPIDVPGILAESWEVSCHPNGPSVIANGPLAGLSLPEAVERFGAELVGDRLPEKDLHKFPLLAKFIDAADRLSVQVHPDDDYARTHEAGEYGKNEMWYVVDADPGARLTVGVVPGTTRAAFAEAVVQGRCESLLQSVEVKPGDVVDIPAGLVHAIGRGILIYEVQQNSDTTYRVFDFDRVDAQGRKRPLHIEKALEVIDFDGAGRPPLCPGVAEMPEDGRVQSGVSRRVLVTNRYFTVEELTIARGTVTGLQADGGRFRILTAIDGDGLVHYRSASGFPSSMPFRRGESLLVPATLGAYRLEGALTVVSSMPAPAPGH